MSSPHRSVEDLLRAGRDLLEESRRLSRELDEQLRRFPGTTSGLEVRTVADGRHVWLFLTGELRAASVRRARVAFDDALYLNPGRDVAIDVRGVDALDGDGVLEVLRLVEAATRERRSVAIVNASDEVAAQMRLIGIISAYGGYPLGRDAGTSLTRA